MNNMESKTKINHTQTHELLYSQVLHVSDWMIVRYVSILFLGSLSLYPVICIILDNGCFTN